MSRELLYALQAAEDLEGILDFVATHDPRRALSYVEEIRAACRALCHTPFMGVERPDLRPGLRLLPLRRRVVVAYEVAPERVRVLRVFSGGQDLDALLDGPA